MAQKRVVVIGGGSTGCAVAHDLALRGFEVVVIERGELASATTGRCSCFLHSGARYVVTDTESAVEAIEENAIIKRIMPPHTMETNGGLFILLKSDDPSYADRFFDGCHACGVSVEEITPEQAWSLEPNLTREISRAAIIPDGVAEPLRFTLAFAATARVNGARFLSYTEVEGFLMQGNRVTGVRAWDRVTSERFDVRADLVVNAAGPWADKVSTHGRDPRPAEPEPGRSRDHRQAVHPAHHQPHAPAVQRRLRRAPAQPDDPRHDLVDGRGLRPAAPSARSHPVPHGDRSHDHPGDRPVPDPLHQCRRAAAHRSAGCERA